MSNPTIVLVHGAFGDASSWRPVYDLLDGDGYTVIAAANPLRGVASDASHLEAIIDRNDGPVVYVAALVPDEGESVGELQERFPSLAMGPILQQTELPDGGVDLSVNPERFHDVFSADVDEADAAFMAHAQRPVAAAAFGEPATVAAWRTKPSWAVFGTADLPVAAELQRFEYARAGSTVTEVEGASHFLMRSNPDVVAGVIRLAATASTANPVA
jgi:pimeloyl-ACP methyl ester carboxylesterase